MTDSHAAGQPARQRDGVAVTGMGVVSPHGVGVPAFWTGVIEGRSAAAPITTFDASAHGVRFACQAPHDLGDLLPRRLLRQTDRFAQMGLIAAEEALVDAGLVRTADPTARRLDVADVDPDRVAVVMASGAGGISEVTEQHQRLLDGGPDRVRPYLSIAMPINMAAGQVAIRHGLRGPAGGVVSACASAADALGNGLDLIRAGRADVVIAGGAEAALTPLMMAGFHAAGAMSTRNEDPAGASRPFDRDRDGFVAGEGSAVLVLESLAHARARGARVHAHLAGYGATNDAYDPTRPPPGGEGAVRAMRVAIADAGLVESDIDHVNAHGTSTPLNDVAESIALNAVFSAVPPVTSIKSSIGHLLGAAGAVEAVAVVQSLTEQVLPPTINLREQDPECRVDVVTAPRRQAVGAVVSNSFGFGGHNAVLVFTQPSTDDPCQMNPCQMNP